MRGRRPAERSTGAAGLVLPPGTELLWGRNSVREALCAGKRVRRLFVAREARPDEPVDGAVRLAYQLKVPVEEVSARQLDQMVLEHQGLAAAAAPYQYVGWGDLLHSLRGREMPPLVLILDTVQDPQNLGTLLRTAEAVGVDAVVLPKRRSVHVTPAVVRSSAGAVEHLSIALVPNLARAAQDLKEAGLWVAGIDMAGDRPCWELDMSGPTALVLGGEDRGIGQLLKEHCDFLIRLPMAGHVNSLNAAVAGSVVLYEVVRQREQASSRARRLMDH